MELIYPQINSFSEPTLSALYAIICCAVEMGIVLCAGEQKPSFLQSQHKYYLTEYPHALFRHVIFDEDRIGHLHLTEFDDETRIIDLIILPEYCGKAIGAEIIPDILQKSAKSIRIYLETFNQLIGLFKRLVFRRISEEKKYHLR